MSAMKSVEKYKDRIKAELNNTLTETNLETNTFPEGQFSIDGF